MKKTIVHWSDTYDKTCYEDKNNWISYVPSAVSCPICLKEMQGAKK